jgi:cytochrome P450
MPETTISRRPVLEKRLPPGPRGHWFLGIAPDVDRDPLGTLTAISRQYGDVVRYRFLIWYGHLVNRPDFIKQVLVDNNHNYSKNTVSFRGLRPLVGNGLLTSDGDFWLRQRRLMQPAFHKQQIDRFSRMMTETAERTLKDWFDHGYTQKPFNVANEMMRLTLSVVGQALFSQDLSSAANTVGPAFTEASEGISQRMRSAFQLPLSLPTPRNRRMTAAIQQLDRVVHQIIQQRRSDLDAGRTVEDDLLTVLVKAQDETSGQGMTDQQLRDEVMTLLLAGHETTANTLSWTWYLLSQHPEVNRKLQAELRSVLNGRAPVLEDLANLPYNRMVIQEAMRLYPPAWFISRLAEEEDEIGGYTIPAQSMVSFSPYLMHHHPDFWDNPEGFDPERFSPENSAIRPGYAYFPFGGGPRLCIGRDFAMTEAQLVLATIASRLRLDLVPGKTVVPDPLITLRPSGGVWVMARENRE